MNIYGKRPRQYAAEIIVLPTLEQRRAALALVPSEWRDWVKGYVVDYFGKQHFLKLQTRKTIMAIKQQKLTRKQAKEVVDKLIEHYRDESKKVLGVRSDSFVLGALSIITSSLLAGELDLNCEEMRKQLVFKKTSTSIHFNPLTTREL